MYLHVLCVFFISTLSRHVAHPSHVPEERTMKQLPALQELTCSGGFWGDDGPVASGGGGGGGRGGGGGHMSVALGGGGRDAPSDGALSSACATQTARYELPMRHMHHMSPAAAVGENLRLMHTHCYRPANHEPHQPIQILSLAWLSASLAW